MTDLQKMITSRVTPDVGAGRIMATDGGGHPASLWAQIVVDDLCSLGPNLDPSQHTAALRMKADMMDLLEPVFDKIMDRERQELSADFSRMVSGVDPTPHIDDVLADILKASKGTRWESIFTAEMNVPAIKQLLSGHIASLLFAEHSWHADRNPDHESAVTFRQTHHPFATMELSDEMIAEAKAQNRRNEPGG